MPTTRLKKRARRLTIFFWAVMATVAYGADDIATRYDAMAIQGDLSRASTLFESSPANGWSEEDRALALAFEQRFGPKSRNGETTEDSDFSQSVSAIYREYWRAGLLGEPGAEDRLRNELGNLLSTQPGDSVYTALRRALDDRGVHHDERPGPPLRDLLLWKEQRRARYTVELTDRAVYLAVNFIDGVALRGWKDYASLGRVSTTGWVHDGELYCLADAYDTSSENFRVSFLKHEARHIADLAKWPDMNAVELEYRAKLTELVYAARSTLALLDDFTAKAAPNPDSPHAMANWRIVHDMHRALFDVENPPGFGDWTEADKAAVARVARRLLRQGPKMENR